jgi:acyl-CoA dehydrogenase
MPRDCTSAAPGRESSEHGAITMQPTDAAEAMADFARHHVAPQKLWRAADFPWDIWQAMGATGLFRIGLAEGGYSAIAAADAALAEAGGAPGFASAWTGHQLVARFMVHGFGTEQQRAAWMPGLASGKLTACVAISEAGVGAHPKKLSTTATLQDSEIRLDGEKAWVSNAPHADLVIVFAISRMDGDRKRYSAYVVLKKTPGLSLIEGRDLGALRPSRHSGLQLAGCVVPSANRLGPPDTAFEAMAIPFRDIEDAVAASGMTGTMRHLLHRLAAATDKNRDDAAAAALGALAASVALASDAATSLAIGLDAGSWRGGAAPATLTGIRLLCEDLLTGMRRYRSDFAPGQDDAIDVLFGDIALLLGVAKGPRMVKQGRIGMALLRQAPTREEEGA